MKVSVILTSYNHGKFLRKCIESVLNQTYQDYELIIIDDCSGDDSCEIIESYHDKRIRFIKHEYNYGSGNVKEGVENYAKGEYIAILHSDDFWREDKLEKQVEFLDNNKECGAVFTGVQVINDDDTYYNNQEGFYYKIFNQPNRSRYEWLRFFFFNGNCLCHPSMLIRKELYKEERLFQGGYPYRQNPDFVMWTKLCLKYDIYILPDKLTYFRVHKNENENTSGYTKNNAIRNAVELFSYNRYFLEITEEHEFVKVFPEWEQYSNKIYFNNKYALARMCLLPETANYTKLFGLQLLNEVFSDEKEKQDIIKFYNFNNVEYFKLAGKYDIFNMFVAVKKQFSTLYYDERGEFSLEKSIRAEYDFVDRKVFEYKYFIELDKINNNVLYFRFDPSENILIKCKIKEFKVNGSYLNVRPIKSVGTLDGEDVFGTTDPMYIVEMPIRSSGFPIKLDIVISGEVKKLSDEEIACFMVENEKLNSEKKRKSFKDLLTSKRG